MKNAKCKIQNVNCKRQIVPKAPLRGKRQNQNAKCKMQIEKDKIKMQMVKT